LFVAVNLQRLYDQEVGNHTSRDDWRQIFVLKITRFYRSINWTKDGPWFTVSTPMSNLIPAVGRVVHPMHSVLYSEKAFLMT